MVDINLNVESMLSTRRADCILGYIRRSITSQSKEVIVPLYSASVWPHLECWVQCWAPQFITDMKVLECIQSTATKPGKGLEALSSEEQLRTLRCHSLKQRRLSPYCSLQLPKVRKQEGDADVSSGKMHGNGSEWHQRRCRLNLNLRKYFFNKTVESTS